MSDKLSASQEDKMFRLLGDLPKFDVTGKLQLPPESIYILFIIILIEKTVKHHHHHHHHQKPATTPKILSPSKAPHNIPVDFVCAINGHVLHNPLRSPYGHVFEKDTIIRWLDENGNTCPITGKPLKPEDLKQDPELEKSINQWQIQRLMKMNVIKVDKEDDLYSF